MYIYEGWNIDEDLTYLTFLFYIVKFPQKRLMLNEFSGRQLQRTPVATPENTTTTTMQSDSIPSEVSVPFALRLENGVHCQAQATNTSLIGDVHCKDNMTLTSVSSGLDHMCHEAGNALSSCSPESDYCVVEPDMESKECVQPHSSGLPPVPSTCSSLPVIPLQSDHGVQVEDEVLSEKKPNVIPTGQQIPRTPKKLEQILNLGLEDALSSNAETADSTGIRESCRERGHSTQDQGKANNVEEDACHVGSIAPLSFVPPPLETLKMLNIKSPTQSCSDHSLPVDEGLPVYCVLSPPSGYRDEGASRTYSKTLEGKCSAVKSGTTVSESPSLSSPGNNCVHSNRLQEDKKTCGKIPDTTIHDYKSTSSSGSSCRSQTYIANDSESPVSTVRSDDQSAVLFRLSEASDSEVSNNENPSSGVTFAASPSSGVTFVASPSSGVTFGTSPSSGVTFGTSPSSGVTFAASPSSGVTFAASPSSGVTFVASPSSGVTFVASPAPVSNNEATFIRNSESTFVSNNENTFVHINERTFVIDNKRKLVNNNERTLVNDNDRTFVSNNDGTFVNDNEGTFVNDNEGTYVNDHEGTFVSKNEGTFVSNNEGVCGKSVNLEKLMKNISIESTDYSDALFPRQGAGDKQKHVASDEKNISALCENIELNCSLKESGSPGEVDGEKNHMVQNDTYAVGTNIMSAKKLHGERNHRETNKTSYKECDGTFIVAKNHVDKSISSKTTNATVQVVRRDEAVSDASNSTIISPMQNEELFSTKDSDDTLEIFPHKHKACRGKKDTASSGIFALTHNKLVEKMDESERGYCMENEGNDSEADKATHDDLECAVIKKPILTEKVLKKKRPVKEKCIEYKVDSPEKIEVDNENVADVVHLDKKVKLVFKDCNTQGKRGRTKIKDKEAPTTLDTDDKENTNSKPRKGKTQKKTLNVMDVDEPKEINVESVKKEARNRRCKQTKKYRTDLSSSSSADSDDSWMSIERKGAKSKTYAKNRKEKQITRFEKGRKYQDDDVSEEHTEEDDIQSHTVVEEQTEPNDLDEVFKPGIISHHMTVVTSPSAGNYCDKSDKNNEDFEKSKIEIDKLDKDSNLEVQNADDTCDIFIKPKRTTVKASRKFSKRTESNDSGTSNKENEDQEQSPLEDKSTRGKTGQAHPKKSNQDSKGSVEQYDNVNESKFVNVMRNDVKPRRRPKKNSENNSKKTNENYNDTQEKKTVEFKGHQKKNIADHDAVDKCNNAQEDNLDGERRVVKSKSHQRNTDIDKPHGNETAVRSRSYRKKPNVEETSNNESAINSKHHLKKTNVDEEPANETIVKTKSRRKKTEEDEEPVKETIVKPKSQRKKADVNKDPANETVVRSKTRPKKTDTQVASKNETVIKLKSQRKKTDEDEDPGNETIIKSRGRRGRQKKMDTGSVTVVKSRGRPKKTNLGEALDDETEKKGKKIKDTDKKDEQPCAEVTRGRRTCKLKARAALSELLNDSLI